MGQREPERLADDLRGGGGAEELAAAARRRAGPAAQLGRLGQAQLAEGEAGADRLDAPVSSPCSGGSVTPPGTSTEGSVPEPASAIIIAGSPLSQVATPRTPRRVGSERISRRKTDRRVVAVGQAVEHPRRSLGASVAGVGAVRGEGDAARLGHDPGRLADQEPDLPVSGVVAEGDRGAVVRPQPSLGAEQEELGSAAAGRGSSPSRRSARARRGRRSAAPAASSRRGAATRTARAPASRRRRDPRRVRPGSPRGASWRSRRERRGYSTARIAEGWPGTSIRRPESSSRSPTTEKTAIVRSGWYCTSSSRPSGVKVTPSGMRPTGSSWTLCSVLSFRLQQDEAPRVRAAGIVRGQVRAVHQDRRHQATVRADA